VREYVYRPKPKTKRSAATRKADRLKERDAELAATFSLEFPAEKNYEGAKAAADEWLRGFEKRFRECFTLETGSACLEALVDLERVIAAALATPPQEVEKIGALSADARSVTLAQLRGLSGQVEGAIEGTKSLTERLARAAEVREAEARATVIREAAVRAKRQTESLRRAEAEKRKAKEEGRLTGKGAGFVYVMVNPSMPGQVKIGFTNRKPEARVAELSASTGVPTPFILVYWARFKSARVAERKVHKLLRKERVNASREFFRVSPKRAIDAVIKVAEVET
jgi:hypothetical protein